MTASLTPHILICDPIHAGWRHPTERLARASARYYQEPVILLDK